MPRLLRLATKVAPIALEQSEISVRVSETLQYNVDSVFKNAFVSRRRFFHDPFDSQIDNIGKSLTSQAEMIRAASDAVMSLSVPIQRIQTLFSTTQIFSVPAFDAHLFKSLELSPMCRRTPMIGLASLGGAKVLSEALHWVRGHPDEVVVCVAAETTASMGTQAALKRAKRCHEASERSKLLGEVVSMSLLADGAAAALIVGDDVQMESSANLSCVAMDWRLIDSLSITVPNTQDGIQRFAEVEGFRSQLHPKLAERTVPALHSALERFLFKHGFSLNDAKTGRLSVCMHPGGPKILRTLENLCGWKSGELDETAPISSSWKALQKHGNCSSVSIFHVSWFLLLI